MAFASWDCIFFLPGYKIKLVITMWILSRLLAVIFFPRSQHLTCFSTLKAASRFPPLPLVRRFTTIYDCFLRFRITSVFTCIMWISFLNRSFQLNRIHAWFGSPLVFVLSWPWCRFLWVQFVSSALLFCNPKQTWTSQALDSSSLNHKFVFPTARATALIKDVC